MLVHEPDLPGADAMGEEEVVGVGIGGSTGAFNPNMLVAEGGTIQELPRAVVLVVPVAVVDFGCHNAPKVYRHGVVFLGLVGAACQATDCLLVKCMWHGLRLATNGRDRIWLGVETGHVDWKSFWCQKNCASSGSVMTSVRRILRTDWALLEQVNTIMKAEFSRPLTRMSAIPLHPRPILLMMWRLEERLWMMEGQKGKS